jgi:dTDP-4-dehydrorhamnose 3,5-epimerase
MKAEPTALPGVLLIEPTHVGDARGFFMELWRAREYAELGIPSSFVQDNIAFSQRAVLRGLHFQNPNPQGKLVAVPQGEVFDVVVDVRIGSPTFGEWQSFILSARNHRQLWIPPGFAHGYQVISETALFTYKCTAYYDSTAELAVAWNDPDLAIDWPLEDAIVSAKDETAPPLSALPEERLFRFRPPEALSLA